MTTVPTFSGFDPNGDGKISYVEFWNVMVPILEKYDIGKKDNYISNGQGWFEDSVDEITPMVNDGWFDPRTRFWPNEAPLIDYLDKHAYSITIAPYINMLWKGIGGHVDGKSPFGEVSIYRVLDINGWLKVTDEEKRKYIAKCQ